MMSAATTPPRAILYVSPEAHKAARIAAANAGMTIKEWVEWAIKEATR